MKSSSTPKQHFAKNQAELAKLLGTSRQLISYHSKQSGSPGHRADGRYPVGEWRSYLQAFGRVDVSEGAPHHGQGNASFADLCDYGATHGLERAAGVLPLVLTESLRGQLPPQELAKLTAEVWCALATRLTGYLTADGPRPCPMETPPQILAMCAKVGVACPAGIDVGMDTEQ